MTPASIEDAFTLDVRVVEDAAFDDGPLPCSTDNGCAPTCASSCNSAN